MSLALLTRAVAPEVWADYDAAMTTLKTVLVSELHESPENPRRDFGNIPELAATLESQGLIEPIVVRPREEGGYWIVAGARRSRALKHNGTKKTDVVIRDYTPTEALGVMLVENKDRESLNPIELARGYQGLIDMGVSKADVAKQMGVSQATVYAYASMLRLPNPIQTAISSGKLPADAGRAIAGVDGERLQLSAFNEAMKLTKPGEKGPSIRAVLRLVQQRFSGKAKKGLNKVQRETKEHGAELAIRRQVPARLLERVGEDIERRPHFSDADLRVLAMALRDTGSDVVREVFQRRGVHPDRLNKVSGSQLRRLVHELVLAPWVALEGGEYTTGGRVVAKAYNQSLAELERGVAATEEAEKLFRKE